MLFDRGFLVVYMLPRASQPTFLVNLSSCARLGENVHEKKYIVYDSVMVIYGRHYLMRVARLTRYIKWNNALCIHSLHRTIP